MKNSDVITDEGGVTQMEKVAIRLDSEALDEAIEKANRLIGLLREVKQIVDSLSGTEKSEA